jgi:glyoxylase-like metal-dependent hydrolase (beta-lactamase superfamily II)
MIERLKVNGTNCWIYAPSQKGAEHTSCVIIDPGADAPLIIKHLEKLEKMGKMEKNAVYPSHIILTHGHFDHIAALPDLAAYYTARGIGVEIAIHREDAPYLGSDSLELHRLCWIAA